MAFGRRSNDTLPGGGPGGDRSGSDLPPHILRLIETMDRIFRQAADVVSTLRQGRPISASMLGMPLDAPFDLIGYEKLFEHVDDVGNLLFSTYYFTQDIKSLDPDAQYQLSLIHQKALQFNMLMSRGQFHDSEALAPLLDSLLVKSAYFGHCFKSYTIVAGILSGRLDNAALNAATQAHHAGWAAAMNRAKAAMLNPATLLAHAPMREPALLLSTSGPYQDGQRVIDGAVFAPELAAVLMKRLAAMQAQGQETRACAS